LTLLTILLCLIHDHSHKYLYQLAPTCVQKPVGRKKKRIYERKTNEIKMADFNL